MNLSRDFRSHAPGYWPAATDAEWNDWRWHNLDVICRWS